MTFTSLGGRLFARVLDAGALVASLLVVGLMIFLVVARYIFGWSIIGLLEVIMMFGMWLYMLGALIASRRNEHLVVDFFAQRIAEGRARAAHRLVVGCITFAATAFFTLLAWRMLKWGLSHPQTTPGLGIPLWIPQSAILVAAVGSGFYALRDIVLAARDIASAPVRPETRREEVLKLKRPPRSPISQRSGFAQPGRSAGAKRCFANSPPHPPRGAQASLGAARREA